MREELIAQLDQWHEDDEIQNIVDAVTEIPAEERDYTLVSHLGRALNNLERYEEALEQFMSVQDEGENDPLWHFRVGFANYYLKRYEEAVAAFEAADRLEPDDEDTLELLGLSRRKAAKRAAKEAAREAAMKKTSVTKTLPKYDYSGFWDESGEGSDYEAPRPNDALIASVEEQLVFKLPTFYVNMMKQHNGGVPRNNKYMLENGEVNGQAEIRIAGIRGIGRDAKYALCGPEGNLHAIDTWNYPEFGVIIADAPSPEQGVVMLDYREAGNDGEPEVVYVHREPRQIIPLAPNVESFVRGLVKSEE
ncbi:SMI1/KNR4 family protein [Paenibacillus sp. NFR01]|uniref:SMI1/KNR4 family protein n=1 Tax=Paenibacillus sp. NFR01 TaxID=1566279 RepID=UPI0008C411F6|nr:SMI1/KNR4 family protein [Paenibacillus sp. NFR01]SET97095.1 SMI1 / KNR4 family (SUKH-1) [Paenibacillus sp. NFR01]